MMATIFYNSVIFLICFCIANGSYLSYPRINFAGQFRADTDTRNNIECNFRLNFPVSDDYNADWGFNGTNEFEWFENVVTSVVLEDGNISFTDPIVGKQIVSNLKRPYAKITDLDVDYQQKSTIYGMKFGIIDNILDPMPIPPFIGNWTPSIIAQDIWQRMPCYSQTNNESQLFQPTLGVGASSTTQIDNIQWSDNLLNSPALQKLKAASKAAGDKLSVRVSMSYYTRNLPSYVPINATLGYVVGTIGVPSPTDTLNVGGQRILLPVSGSVPAGMKFKEDDICYNYTAADEVPWLGKSPFEIDTTSKEIHLDLSNSLTVDFYNTIRNIGTLQLGILSDDSKTVKLIDGEIPYLTENWVALNGGIYTASLSDDEIEQLSNSKLVVVQIIDESSCSYDMCGSRELFSTNEHSIEILLEESPYFIRPTGYYVDRLSIGNVSHQTFYVTYFGQPAKNVFVEVQQYGEALPTGGVGPDENKKLTDDKGLVSFDFTIKKEIPYPRKYASPPCPDDDPNNHYLLVDGNVYQFNYRVCPSSEHCLPWDDSYQPTFLAFSNVKYPPKVNWVDHVGPVLSLYARIAPIMKYIIDMSSYNEVTQPHNKELLKLALTRDFNDPAYMPTTRNLSPVKRNMILSWLQQDKPLYDSSGNEPPHTDIQDECNSPHVDSFQEPFYSHARCNNSLSKYDPPSVLEPYFSKISDPSNPFVIRNLDSTYSGRPLMGLASSGKEIEQGTISPIFSEHCTPKNLKTQLQTAIKLEFSTIPVYLTSLYSIKDGCNQDVYERIRSVIMQEMLHMTQVANILIATNGSPNIDDPDFVLPYPTILPGEVLSGMKVRLRKLSLEHIFEIFMGIEVPQVTHVGNPPVEVPPANLTIGTFYEEIIDCIEYLHLKNESIFNPETVSRQVHWPWDNTTEVGDLLKVTDATSATNAIVFIVSQGEGADMLDPTSVGVHDLAHFFKFEEIVCGHELVEINDTNYAYRGKNISFDKNGVWNMRDDPTYRNIEPHTNCYVEARAFHGVFRSLLRNLHEVFNGHPEKISEAVEIMESLHVHAKKTMWTKFTPNSDETCGPVWEYEWPIILN